MEPSRPWTAWRRTSETTGGVTPYILERVLRRLASRPLVPLLAQGEDLPDQDLRGRRGRDRDDGAWKPHELRHEEDGQRRDQGIDVYGVAEDQRAEDAAFQLSVEDEVDARGQRLERAPGDQGEQRDGAACDQRTGVGDGA